MPIEATYDKGELFRLMRITPPLSAREVARALTRFNVLEREVNTLVTVNTVWKARHRYQLELRGMGVHAKGKSALIAELQRRTGHSTFPAEQHYNSRELRYLRLMSRLEAGKPIPARDRAELESWDQRLRESKRVVDVTPDGVPYTRHAMDGELTPKGELYPGGAGLLTSAK